MQLRIASLFALIGISGFLGQFYALTIFPIAPLFIFEGILAFLLGLISCFILPHSPLHISSLSEEGKTYVIIKLQEDGASGDAGDVFDWQHVRKTFTLPQVWIAAIVLFLDGDYLTFFMYNTFLTHGFAGIIIHSFLRIRSPIRHEPSMLGVFIGLSLRSRGDEIQIYLFFHPIVLVIPIGHIPDYYGCRGVACIVSGILSVIGFAILVGEWFCLHEVNS